MQVNYLQLTTRWVLKLEMDINQNFETLSLVLESNSNIYNSVLMVSCSTGLRLLPAFFLMFSSS